MREKRNKKELIAVCLLVLSLVLITVGTTFALFQYSRQGETENKIQTGTLTFVYDESKSNDGGVSIENAFPMSDEEGKVLGEDKSGVFDFDVRAKTEGADINYEIYLTKEEESTLPEYIVKTYLITLSGEEENDITGEGLPTGINLYSALYDSKVPSLVSELKDVNAKTLYRETIENGNKDYTKTFRYRMWIDNEANQIENGSWKYNNMTFSVKVNVYAQNDAIPEPTAPGVYKDKSGANSPELIEGLIPVKYDNNKKSWVKADLNQKWYDYEMQEWANAVTIGLDEDGNSTARETYQKADPGTPIKMDDINTMWVWIPRYEYMFTNLGDQYAGGSDINHPGAIGINFISGTNTQVSDESNYKMHPAFTFGEDELTGFWYGKFETSNQEGHYEENNSTLTPIIKPNVTFWAYIHISSMFYASRNMQIEKYDTYGFKNDLTSYDTHMSKNREWGAVAYLSQSKYGKYGNSAYEVNDKEVYINNCSQKITGIAGDTVSAQATDTTCNTNTYETMQGQKASTTGNITGVYDMSGGALEYVMGAYSDGQDPAKPPIEWSRFTDDSGAMKIPDAKYYDLYTKFDPSSYATICDGGVCYGHALSETERWYGDSRGHTDNWLWRGADGRQKTYAGVFTFGSYAGNGDQFFSFRLVLAPIKQ